MITCTPLIIVLSALSTAVIIMWIVVILLGIWVVLAIIAGSRNKNKKSASVSGDICG